jgi:hypothetical protein
MTQTPVQPIIAAPVKHYAIGNLKVSAQRQPELHALVTELSSAAKELRKAKGADALQKQFGENVVPALLAVVEGLVAKVGGLEHWCGTLEERIEDLEDEISLDPEDGDVILRGLRALAGVVSSLDVAQMSEADQERIRGALALGKAAEAMALDCMGEGDDEGDEDGEGDEDEDEDEDEGEEDGQQ